MIKWPDFTAANMPIRITSAIWPSPSLKKVMPGGPFPVWIIPPVKPPLISAWTSTPTWWLFPTVPLKKSRCLTAGKCGSPLNQPPKCQPTSFSSASANLNLPPMKKMVAYGSPPSPGCRNLPILVLIWAANHLNSVKIITGSPIRCPRWI